MFMLALNLDVLEVNFIFFHIIIIYGPYQTTLTLISPVT